jgi:MoxR-like ATPase
LGSEPLVFEAKSTSTARALFYTFDMIGRFHAAQTGLAGNSNLDYLSYNALGKAVLLANERCKVESWLPKDFVHDGPKRSVVLIDEIDKAPRDFPNDILNEVENMYFKVPELGNPTISAPEGLKPILIVTSNSEKSLPDAFLRRCVYYNIPFPKSDRLAEIVRGRIENVRSAPSSYLQQALEFFDSLRNAGLRKKPATAELLGWLLYLGDRIPDKNRSLRGNPDVLSASLSALVKSAEDQEVAQSVLKEWLSKG